MFTAEKEECVEKPSRGWIHAFQTILSISAFSSFSAVKNSCYSPKYAARTRGSFSTTLARSVKVTRPGEPALLGLARHREAFEQARDALVEALQEHDAVLVAEGLRRAVGAFGSVSGRVGVEDLLGHIFGRFCIGK